MSRWKTATTTRRPRRSHSRDSCDDLDPPTQTKFGDGDNLHLSFLDDMLGGTTSNTGYTSGNQFSYSGTGGSSAHCDSGGSNPLDPNDIDDILDLVNSETRTSPPAEEPAFYNATTTNALSRSRHGNSSSASFKKQQSEFSPSTKSVTRSSNGSITNSKSSHKISRGEALATDIPSQVLGVDGAIVDLASPSHMALHPATFEQAPLFGAILNMERDDDTISQITSSVTSQSFYDSTTEGSRSSYPWLRGKGSRASNSSPKLSTYSHGETSFADTLDEIADMIGPRRGAGGGSLRSPIPPSRQTRQIPSGNDPLFRNSPKNNMPVYPSRAEASRLKGEESYRNSSTSSLRRASSRRHMTQWTSMFEPFLSQFRLSLRYISKKIVPNNWVQKKGRKAKEDEHETDGEQEDYFGELIRGQVSSKTLTKAQRSSKQGSSLRDSLIRYGGFFCTLTVLLLISKLAMMHSQKARMNRRTPKLSEKHDVVLENVRGGMSNRESQSKVRGGMTHHSGPSNADSKAMLHAGENQKRPELSHFDHVGLYIPEHFDNLVDISTLPVKKGIEIPFFWHIPRTGGGTVHDIIGECLSLTLASDAGGTGSGGQDHKLQVVKHAKFNYVNVDTSNPQGIERAKRLDLAGSELVDVVVSTLLYPASTLFSPSNKGRMFTIFRHPVERAISLFHYVQDTQWRRRQSFQKELADLTIEEYFKSGLAENNWMTRFLTNELTKSELTKKDVNLAKEIVRRKCLVGLLKEKGESFARFERYFGFPLKNDVVKECHEKKLQWAWPLKHRHDEVEEGSPLWDLIMSHNQWDIELYEYVQTVFQEQAKIFQ